MSRMVVTPAQMDSAVKAYRNCGMVAKVLAEVHQGPVIKTIIRRDGQGLMIDALAPAPVQK